MMQQQKGWTVEQRPTGFLSSYSYPHISDFAIDTNFASCFQDCKLVGLEDDSVSEKPVNSFQTLLLWLHFDRW
jgi:hypothetical protein